MRLGFLAALPACLFAAAPAGAEDIAVRGAFHPVVVSTLGRMQATADAIRLKDGRPNGLHLHVRALLEPGDRPPEDARLFFDARQGHLSLFPDGGNEIVFPADTALQAENPNVVASLSSDQEISFQATVSIDQPPATRFTGRDARGWMKTLDRQIGRKAGFVLSAFLPETRTVTITLPPRSEFSVTESGRTSSLVRNRGDKPYDFTFQPRAYPAEAVFESTRPIAGMTMVFPVRFDSWKRPPSP
ncbi:hypothetical protein [Gluconacetobacter takamatsuzukensis]|uniref:Uncharacterized protein n=1 Tax=Gluconacetobacter takamatsuzukensis TaxID=1286190 RepID=A0A7W4PR81_9PROT|nr:hypothetical protein [Gluconacetobacter takamatsuzukensis]MBB2205209.1 hypothetical protein [Gluconacetobacter takamatsuzukensis]